MEFLHDWLGSQYIWILVGFLLLLMEFAIPGLITVFFGVAAILVGILTFFFDLTLNVQLTIFIAISVTLILLLRKWFLSFFSGDESNQTEDKIQSAEYIGKKVVVTKQIHPERPGKVELHGTNWTAEADAFIAKGASVEIIGKRNITLFVRQI